MSAPRVAPFSRLRFEFGVPDSAGPTSAKSAARKTSHTTPRERGTPNEDARVQIAAAKIDRGEPVTAPGVPKNYPDPSKLVTEDCIRPISI